MVSVEEIAAELRVDEAELAFLEGATAGERATLLATIRAAGEQRDRQLREAVDGALGVVPRPLRGRVIKLLRGSR